MGKCFTVARDVIYRTSCLNFAYACSGKARCQKIGVSGCHNTSAKLFWGRGCISSTRVKPATKHPHDPWSNSVYISNLYNNVTAGQRYADQICQCPEILDHWLVSTVLGFVQLISSTTLAYLRTNKQYSKSGSLEPHKGNQNKQTKKSLNLIHKNTPCLRVKLVKNKIHRQSNDTKLLNQLHKTVYRPHCCILKLFKPQD